MPSTAPPRWGGTRRGPVSRDLTGHAIWAYPSLQVDRHAAAAAAAARSGLMAACRYSIIGQLAAQLADAPFEALQPSTGQLWTVTLAGEGAMDSGGAAREVLRAAALELCPSVGAASAAPLFRETHNGGAWMPLPLPARASEAAAAVRLLRFVGRLAGACLRSNNPLEVVWPPLLWKQLLRMRVGLADLAGVDATAAAHLVGQEPRCWSVRSRATERTLLLRPGVAADEAVAPADEEAHAAAAMAALLGEAATAVAALRAGLEEVVPPAALRCMTWRLLQDRVCGEMTVDAAVLRATCRVEAETEEQKATAAWLWQLLEVAPDECSRLLAFVTGSGRLPPGTRKWTLIVSGDPSAQQDGPLPTAATCGCVMRLPCYASFEVTRAKVLTALDACADIDSEGGRGRRDLGELYVEFMRHGAADGVAGAQPMDVDDGAAAEPSGGPEAPDGSFLEPWLDA